MDLKPHESGVIHVTAADLKAFAAKHPDEDLLLIDVREPDEYRTGHIPGARHTPLSRLMGELTVIGASPEPTKVFYCHTGIRSARAAGAAARLGMANVFNLIDGIAGWRGQTVPRVPRFKVFEEVETIADLLRQAMELEKGAELFYRRLRDHFAASPIASAIVRLAKAEVGHARVVHGKLVSSGLPVAPFEEMYAQLEGRALENGEPLLEALEPMIAISEGGDIALLELALTVEYQAYDLYRTLAHRCANAAHRQGYLELAEQERNHADGLIGLIGEVASQPPGG